MAWDFSTDPGFQSKLDWMAEFVRSEIYPLETLDLDATVAESVTLVEWGEGLVERLTANRVEVRIAVVDDETRHVVVDGLGVRWAGADLRSAVTGVRAP